MNFRPNVNFGWAFDQLKEALRRSEIEYKKGEAINYVGALGMLHGAVAGIITIMEEPESADDLAQTELFQQSETGKEIDEAIDREIERGLID